MQVFFSSCFSSKETVASRTISAPSLAQSILFWSRSAETLTNLPLTLNPPSLTSTVPSKRPTVFQQVCKIRICVVDACNFNTFYVLDTTESACPIRPSLIPTLTTICDFPPMKIKNFFVKRVTWTHAKHLFNSLIIYFIALKSNYFQRKARFIIDHLLY